MAKRTLRTPEKEEDWYDMFLRVLSRTGNVRLSCVKARIARASAYEHYDSRPKFASRWDDALEAAADRLEREAWRRAVKGVPRPVYYQGEQIDVVREYSDTLLIFLLKGCRPEKYRDNYSLTQLANDLANARTQATQPPANGKAGGRKARGKG